MPERFAIAQVTPHPWEDEHEVNAFAGGLAQELAERGHRLLVLAPSRSPQLVRESRKLIRSARERPEALFDPDGAVRVLGVGELLPLQRRRGGAPSPPVDISRTIEEVLALAPLDFVHVHEPFAPSASSVALRHSRALNVGSFHAPTERVALHAGRAALRGAVLRPPRRPHRLLPGDARGDGALLPGELPPAQAGRRAGRAPALRRSAAAGVLRAGGAPGIATFPARLETTPRGARLAGDGVLAHRRGPDRRAAQPPPGPPHAPERRRHHRDRGAGQRRRRRRGQPRAGARPRAAGARAGRRGRADRRAAARLRGGGRGRPAVRARGRRRARRPARARDPRPAARRAAARAASGPLVEPRGRRGRGHLRGARRASAARRSGSSPRSASGSPSGP